MSVDTTYIENMSNYVFETDFTYDQFTQFYTRALARVNREMTDTRFTSDDKDEATALLICHQIERRKNRLDMSSESMAGYSYNRKSRAAGEPETQWLKEYMDLIAAVTKPAQCVQPSAGARRNDDESTNLRLDQNDVLPGRTYTDGTIQRLS